MPFPNLIKGSLIVKLIVLISVKLSITSKFLIVTLLGVLSVSIFIKFGIAEEPIFKELNASSLHVHCNGLKLCILPPKSNKLSLDASPIVTLPVIETSFSKATVDAVDEISSKSVLVATTGFTPPVCVFCVNFTENAI